MPTIEPAPDGAESAEKLDTPVGRIVVDSVLDGLRLGNEHKEIAKSVGVTVHVVNVIAKNRAWWAKHPPKPSRQRETRPTIGCINRHYINVAPEGSKIVPAYKCGDHRSVFLPCLICIARNLTKKP